MLCHAVQGGMIRYNHNAFWKQRVCPRHVDDGTIKCCSCNRWQPQGEQWVTELDGRTVCLDCLTTIVRDTADAQPLYRQVGHCSPFQLFVNGFRGMGSSNSTAPVSPGRTLLTCSASFHVCLGRGFSNRDMAGWNECLLTLIAGLYAWTANPLVPGTLQLHRPCITRLVC